MSNRLKFPLYHLLISLVVALLAYLLVFHFMYPAPFGKILGAYDLFWLICSVDVVLGPMFTLLVYKPSKPLKEKILDFSLIGLIQIGALSYGLFTLYTARPLVVGFEGDRFRLVQAIDLLNQEVGNSYDASVNEELFGVKPIGVEIYTGGSPQYLKSVEDALSGIHPSFKKERWKPYQAVQQAVLSVSRPLGGLVRQNLASDLLIRKWLDQQGWAESEILYLPLSTPDFSDWIVLVDRLDAKVVGYLPLDGW